MNSIKRISLLFFISLAIIASGSFFLSCEKNEISPKPSVNEWIHEYMTFAYFWNNELPDKKPSAKSNPTDYFKSLLKKPDDRWSFITDNAQELLEYFDGVIKSMGYSIQLYRHNEYPNQVVAVIEFVYPDSPASRAGLQRGNVITKINGTLLTTNNFQDLLNLDEMVVTWGYFVEDYVLEQPTTINLSAVKLETDPILLASVLEVDEQKVGYLIYTSFINKYDEELKSVFANFQQENITELVLDLRYNGGGSVTSAQLLASLIAPQGAVGDIFISEVWNNNLSEYNDNLLIEEQPENLNLERVYILTTEGTASASEMIIYGLQPHMEVIQIGETTYGKYYGSITITADERCSHNWAMQPIVMRAESKDKNINYLLGLVPSFEIVNDDYDNQLGDIKEEFLATAINHIKFGNFEKAPSLKSKLVLKQAIPGYKEWDNPLRTIMYLER